MPTKAKPKRGRPVALEQRTIQVQIRLSPIERNVIASAALNDDRAISQWMRLACLEKAGFSREK